MGKYILGLDLGQAADFTAIVIFERVPRKTGRTEEHWNGRYREQREEWEDHFELRHIERFALHTPYPDVVARIAKMMATEPLVEDTDLIVDMTGVGRPVVDMLRGADLSPIAVTITGGDTVTCENGVQRVPKRVLVSSLQVLLQTARLKVAAALAESSALAKELLNFKVKINLRTAHDSYEAWREGAHDDLVLAAALAAWWGMRTPTGGGWASNKPPKLGTREGDEAALEAMWKRRADRIHGEQTRQYLESDDEWSGDD